MLAAIVRRPVWFCRVAGVEAGGIRLRKPWLVLSRALTRVTRISLPKVPAHRTADAIRLQLLALSPWPETGFAFWRLDDAATLWYWDERELRERLGAVAASRDDVAPIPEAALQPAMAGDGLRMVRCLDGLEAQVWRGGALLASMWWPEFPDAEGWRAFAWDNGLSESDCPDPQALPRSTRLSIPVQVHRPATAARGWDVGMAGRVALAAVGGYAIWLGIHHLRVHAEMRARTAELAAVETRSAALRQTRQALRGDAAAAQRLHALLPEVTQAELMLELSGVAGRGHPLALREWEYRDGRLRVVFGAETDRVDRGAALAALAQARHLRDVQLASDSAPTTLAVVAQVGVQATGSARRAPLP